MIQQIQASVRPLLSVAFAAAFIAGFLIGKIPEQAFTTIATTVIVYYFRQRDEVKREKPQDGGPA